MATKPAAKKSAAPVKKASPKKPTGLIVDPALKSLGPVEAVLTVARQFAKDKYKEGKNNDTIFGKWFGLNNQPWCAMFVSYCFNASGYANLVKGAQTTKGFASCDYGMKWFTKNRQMIAVGKAQAGDIVFFQFDADPQPDHVGIVIANDGKGTLTTVEGNTAADNAGSQSNGDGVYIKKRKYSLVAGVARPKYPIK